MEETKTMKSENWVNLMQLPTQRADGDVVGVAVVVVVVVYPGADATNM